MNYHEFYSKPLLAVEAEKERLIKQTLDIFFEGKTWTMFDLSNLQCVVQYRTNPNTWMKERWETYYIGETALFSKSETRPIEGLNNNEIKFGFDYIVHIKEKK